MLKVILALCLISSLAFGQVTFPVGTSSANQAYTTSTTANGVTTTTQQGSAADTGNGYTVGLDGPGWVLSNALALTAGASPTAVTVYTTLKTATGGYVGVGITQISGNALQTATCSTFSTPHSTASLANTGAGATVSNACPADFITIYTAAPASTSTSTPIATLTLAVNTPVRWVLTPPAATTTAASACVTTVITPFSALSSTTPTAGTTITRNTGGTCELSSSASTYPATKFSLTTVDGSGTAVTAATFAFYVELGPSGTRGEVCFQTTAQFTAMPGVCSSTIISGVLASIGLLVALLFN